MRGFIRSDSTLVDSEKFSQAADKYVYEIQAKTHRWPWLWAIGSDCLSDSPCRNPVDTSPLITDVNFKSPVIY